jgi:hypothetical protein
MKHRFLFPILVIALVTLGACRKQSGSQQNANSATPAPQEAPVGGSAPAGEKFYFRGTIANSLRIEMALVRDGDRLTGTYFYPKVGKNIALAGTVDKDGNVELKETDESGKDTGKFKGKWKPATDSPDPSLNQIEGKWSKPDGSKETEFQVYQQAIELAAAVRVVPKVIKEANKEKRYTVEAEYPQIEGDPRFDSFNREARNLIMKDVAAFKTAETVETGEESDPDSVPGDEAGESGLDVWYDIRYASDDLISVQFTESAYSRGAAHPNSSTQVLNFDVKSGKKLGLADLFNLKSNYLSVISVHCIKALKDKGKDDDMVQSGASPRSDNYRAWSITKKGLWITFDPYQVASYAEGPQYVLVPYSTLKHLIKQDGPVASLAR